MTSFEMLRVPEILYHKKGFLYIHEIGSPEFIIIIQ